MRAFETPEIEILAFQVKDVITTSDGSPDDNDNGFVDIGDLLKLQK